MARYLHNFGRYNESPKSGWYSLQGLRGIPGGSGGAVPVRQQMINPNRIVCEAIPF